MSQQQLPTDYLPTEALPADLKHLVEQINTLVSSRSGDCLGILQLMRVIEELHRAIYHGPFNEALPDTRQALYHLLQDMEVNGSWPYIPRTHIRALLQNLSPTEFNPGVVEPTAFLDNAD